MERIRYLAPRQVEELTSLSERTIARMVEEGKFPRPVRLSEAKKNGRIGYVEDEVLAWNLARLAQRDAKPARAEPTLGRRN